MFISKKNLSQTALGLWITLGFCGISSAEPQPQWNGATVAIEGGPIFLSPGFQTTSTASYEGGENTYTVSTTDNSNESLTSGIGELEFGYARQILNSHFSLGGDVFINVANRKENQNKSQSTSDNDYTGTLSANSSATLRSVEYGADLLPGWIATPTTMIYGRVGVGINNEDISSNNNLNFTNSSDSTQNYTSNLNASNSSSALGLRLGVGVEHIFIEKLSVIVDYIYTIYQNPTPVTASTVDTTNSATLSTSTSSHFSSNAAMIGLKYRFEC